MKYTFEKYSGKTRLAIFIVLLAASVILVITDNFSGFFAGFIGGLLAALLFGELALYLKRRNTASHT